MTKVNHYEILADLQKQYPRDKSNDYLMRADALALIEHGKLHYVQTPDGLFLFAEREGFYKCIFRLRDWSAIIPEATKPMGIYLTYRAECPPLDATQWLLSNGFSHHVTLQRYTARALANGPLSDDVKAAGAEETYAMLSAYFSAEEMDLPTRDLFRRAYCVRADDGSLQGVLNDMGHTRIYAVSPDARGRGIGGRLYRAFAADKSCGQATAPILHEWVRPDNPASISMLKKLGFEQDTRMTSCYVKR